MAPKNAGEVSISENPEREHETPRDDAEDDDGSNPSSDGYVVPMFPLANVCLFPDTAIRLHIFEPRYRAMVRDMLDGPGRFVVATVPEQHHDELEGSPPVEEIGGLGEIASFKELPDGRFNLVVVGLSRVRLEEVPSDQPYRRVHVQEIREDALGEPKEKELRPKLESAIRARSRNKVELPESMSINRLADLLILYLGLPQSETFKLFSRRGVLNRAEAALHRHEREPIASGDGDENEEEG